MLISYYYYKLFKLNLSYKVASRNKLYRHCVKINSPGCNVYGNNPSLLYKVLDEKKRLNVKKKDTLSKIPRLKV